MKILFVFILVLALCGCTQAPQSTPLMPDTVSTPTEETYEKELRRNLVRRELVDRLVVGESDFEDVWEIMLDACDEPYPGAHAGGAGLFMYAVTDDGCNICFLFDYKGNLIHIEYENES